jgi:tetratricopeptide (TPR) repeat protein
MRSRCLSSLAVFSTLVGSALRAQQRAPAACDQFQTAVRTDPDNFDAAARLGQCSVRDYEMIAPGGDSTRLVFRSSWSVALRALRRAVEVDPRYSRAYQPLFAILLAETRDGCSSVTGECAYVSPVLRDGDSVITIPRRVRLNVPGVDTYADVLRESDASRQASLTEARRVAERWSGVAPNDRRPHEYFGRALLELGDYLAASTELELAATLGTTESRRALFWDRFEALVKSDRGDDARRVLDEAVSDPGRDTTRLQSWTIASLNALLGRYRPPPVDSARERNARARIDSLVRTHPILRPPRPAFSDLLAAGDTIGARRRLTEMDSMIAAQEGARRLPWVGPQHLESAKFHLALGDTAGAEARLAEIERVLHHRPFQFSVGLTFSGPDPWMGRAWSLSGDVAVAQGRPDDGARMYRRVIGLWGGGDPDLTPVVDHARARLSSLTAR